MTRLCWVFVLLIVAVPSNARPHKCEQRERSVADLELAEDALKRAKDLYPNCEDENDISNSSECSRKDKSLGFITVALDLVSNAKKSIPYCLEVTTEEPPTTITTEEPASNFTTEDSHPMDCQDLLEAGSRLSGVYTVWPQMTRGKTVPVQVRCDMDTDGGGWTVIQRRGNFTKQENFYRDWLDYKNGFGNLEYDFWLGNDNIFALSNQGNYSLRLDMTAVDGESAYVVYREFWIEDEDSNYTLHVNKYESNSTTGDSMTYSNGQMFSTRDRKNEKWSGNCAEHSKAGFWYKGCSLCNPNGIYKPGVDDITSVFYINFKQMVGLFSMEMKLKRR